MSTLILFIKELFFFVIPDILGNSSKVYIQSISLNRSQDMWYIRKTISDSLALVKDWYRADREHTYTVRHPWEQYHLLIMLFKFKKWCYYFCLILFAVHENFNLIEIPHAPQVNRQSHDINSMPKIRRNSPEFQWLDKWIGYQRTSWRL